MTKTIFDLHSPHPEPSTLVAFAENHLDRRSEHRPDDCVEAALKHPGAHFLAFSGAKLIVKHDEKIIDPLFAPYELAGLEPTMDDAVLLGFLPNGEPRIAVPSGLTEETVPEPFKIADARMLYRQQMLPEELLGQFAQGSSLIVWNANNRFCGRCGGPMDGAGGGYRRICTACGHLVFPRTDPVVIMLTIDLECDQCLLGRSPHFAPGMYSCLAGFVEPGETIENAVRRETLEESGIRIGRVRYHASQPWPLPHSLMIGCYAEARSTAIKRDEQELEDVRWFTRAETEAMLERATGVADTGDEHIPPPKGAIAHQLMRDWLAWPERD
ncbi:NAD(+) diphosphatase [Sinorhizobium medicae]|nr:NAD(+) diphosphatase [Sinorhizobium medicae]MDX0898060.1 NAD(+) diphosphatase [Sinorhizobium medicae]MDX1120459.1 NAD(+) diphosphatase [Sinorhizobium medicae]MDX1240916.1 NAD(+) diphosphatase [Sinorhizobium medicae]